MKKNLISVIILALLIVNIVLTAIMMFSVTGASKKTAALVDNIATALNLELSSGTEGAGAEEAVSMADTETYSFAEPMTIPLKKNEGEDKDRSEEHTSELRGKIRITIVSFPLPFPLTQRLTAIKSMAPQKVWRRWKA